MKAHLGKQIVVNKIETGVITPTHDYVDGKQVYCLKLKLEDLPTVVGTSKDYAFPIAISTITITNSTVAFKGISTLNQTLNYGAFTIQYRGTNDVIRLYANNTEMAGYYANVYTYFTYN